MAKGEFLKALPRELVYEGGKVDDPRDPGGRTNQGVTQRTYDAYRRSKGLPLRDVFLMENAERNEIYQTMYWDRIMGDALPLGLGFCVFDAAVNSGVGQAGKWLQASLGSGYTGQIDGIIGAKTLQAIADHGDMYDLIPEFCSRRLGTLKRLKTWSTYGRGWSARIANVQTIALSWADNQAASGATVHPVDVTPAGGNSKAQVGNNISEPLVSQIATHITTAAGSAGTIASQTAQQITPLTDTFGWIKYAFGGLTLAAVVAGVVVKIISSANDAAKGGTARALVDPDAAADFATVKVDDAIAQGA